MSDAELAALEDLQSKFFEAFTVLNSSAAKLLLLEEKSSEEKLQELKSSFDAFFRIAYIDNEKCTNAVIDTHKESIANARKAFYSELGNVYKANA